MSFSKLDSGITKSSLWSEPLHVRVVFVSFLAEKDENGFVSAAYSSMQRICNVTKEQFDEAIRILESPDPESRTEDFEGRRLQKIEGGWIVLNHEKYRLPEQIKNQQRNEYMKEYMRERRKNQAVNINNELTPVNSDLTSVSVSVSSSERIKEIKDIVDLLNSVCKTQFKPTSKNTIRHIKARMNEGFTLNDFRYVIYYKNDEWSKDPHMMQYLRPDTLFGTKFESYLNAAKKAVEDHKNKKGKNTSPEVVL